MAVHKALGEQRCLYSYAHEDHYPDCQKNSLGNLTKCGIEKCKAGEVKCWSIYNNKGGKFVPDILGCNPNQDVHKCLNGVCELKPAGKSHQGYYTCCCFGNMCNANITFPKGKSVQKENFTTTLLSTTPPSIPRSSSDKLSMLLIVIPIAVIACAVAYLYKRAKRRRHSNKRAPLLPVSMPLVPKESEPSLTLLEVLHQGKMSCVRKAMRGCATVAVKMVDLNQKQLWETEKTMFETYKLRHDNVLQFLLADRQPKGNTDLVKYWIVTEYHKNGSLLQYLKQSTIEIPLLLRMLVCISGGLNFLHTTTPERPAIAHRDLKTANIFVRDDLSCCIGDFGLAVPVLDDANVACIPTMKQVGTRRYMAPEILQGSIGFSWESFLSIDIYAFALVIWELLSRCCFEDVTPVGYEGPYSSYVGADPTINDMIKCVGEHKKRPILHPSWKKNKILNHICETMTEGWDEDAYARVTASCIFERFQQLQQDLVTLDS